MDKIEIGDQVISYDYCVRGVIVEIGGELFVETDRKEKYIPYENYCAYWKLFVEDGDVKYMHLITENCETGYSNLKWDVVWALLVIIGFVACFVITKII